MRVYKIQCMGGFYWLARAFLDYSLPGEEKKLPSVRTFAGEEAAGYLLPAARGDIRLAGMAIPGRTAGVVYDFLPVVSTYLRRACGLPFSDFTVEYEGALYALPPSDRGYDTMIALPRAGMGEEISLRSDGKVRSLFRYPAQEVLCMSCEQPEAVDAAAVLSAAAEAGYPERLLLSVSPVADFCLFGGHGDRRPLLPSLAGVLAARLSAPLSLGGAPDGGVDAAMLEMRDGRPLLHVTAHLCEVSEVPV